VTELVEAIAAVVARNPKLGVTVGVEGVGDPLLLRFFVETGGAGQRRHAGAAPAAEAAPRHADFDIEVEEPVEEPYQAPPAYRPAPAYRPRRADGGVTQRLSRDDQDRYGPASFGYQQDASHYESDTAERRYGSFDSPPAAHDARYVAQDDGETPRDLGARMRDLGLAARDAAPPQPYPPHPFAAGRPRRCRRRRPSGSTPSITGRRPSRPPPSASSSRPRNRRRCAACRRRCPHRSRWQVERPEQTEMAARRLAALLRDDPSLLNQAPD